MPPHSVSRTLLWALACVALGTLFLTLTLWTSTLRGHIKESHFRVVGGVPSWTPQRAWPVAASSQGLWRAGLAKGGQTEVLLATSVLSVDKGQEG